MRVPVQLNIREKVAVCLTLFIIGILVSVERGVIPFLHHRDNLQQAISARTRELEDIRELQHTYVSLKQTMEDIRNHINQREKSFTLFSYLDRLAGKSGIKDNVAYMKPSETDSPNHSFKTVQVEVKIQSLSLHQLTAFLYEAETHDALVSINKASISKSGSSGEKIDVILLVETLAL